MQKIWNIRMAVSVVLCMATIHAYATGYRFNHIRQGLPHQQVEALAEDIDGNIWIGTRNGLCRYNGYDIRTYYNDRTDTTSIQHNFIHQLLTDHKGRLWIRTHKGVSRYDAQHDRFVNYPSHGEDIAIMTETTNGHIVYGSSHLYLYNQQKDCFDEYPSLDFGHILSMTSDRNGNLYMGTNSQILCYRRGLTRIATMPSYYYADFLTGSDGIVAMMVDSRNRLWISRNGKGVEHIDLRTGALTVIEAAQLSDGVVRCITEDAAHRIWLGTERGITVINPNGQIEIIQHFFNEPDLISDNAIYSILADSQGNMWVGSFFGGVDILPMKQGLFSWYKPGYNQGQLRGKVPRQMVMVDSHHVWIATEDGGINILDPETGLFTPFNEIKGMGTNVHCFFLDHEHDEMWIGTFRHGLFRYNLKSHHTRHYMFERGLNTNSIFSITRQKDGTMWIGTTMGLRRYNPSRDWFEKIGHDILDDNFVFTLTTDGSDNVWIGTYSYGLFEIERKNGRILRWDADRKSSHLLDQGVLSLYADSHNYLYIGTNNNGLQRMNLRTRQIESVAIDEQLEKNSVCSIGEDASRMLWVATSNGLFEIDPATLTLKQYSESSGLPTNQFNYASMLRLDDGSMLVGTVNGLVRLHPQKATATRQALEVHLLRLSVAGNECQPATEGSPLEVQIDHTTELRLNYEQARSFVIDYGVIMPGYSGNINYQIKLEGLDDDWRNMGSDRHFYGYNLREGHYTLKVRANSSNSDWDQCRVRELSIVVSPPFYRSLWAYLIYLLLTVAIIYAIYKTARNRYRRISQEHAERIEREKQEAIDKSKMDFFTTVSHELKTPLSLIIAPLKSINRTDLQDKDQHNLDLVMKNAAKMQRLIDQLVTFNKVESDRFPFYLQKDNALMFIEQLSDGFISMAKERELDFSVYTEDNGEEVWFSPSYVEKITSNLLTNAFKFTPKGGRVELKACVTTVEGHADHLYLNIRVSDTGIGIAEEERERIFSLYYQTRRGENVNNGGWGIGLALTKRLVSIHHGFIRLDSSLGRGSCFDIYLDVSPNGFSKECYTSRDKVIVPVSNYNFSTNLQPTVATENNSDSSSAAEKPAMTMLIVEDDNDLRQYLTAHFKDSYNILSACDGAEGLKKATDNNVDIIISDVMMPVMDGVEMCRRLKNDMLTSHIPIILLTAKAATPDVVAGYESGAEAYVAKPFDPQILDLQVKNILALMHRRQSEMLQQQGNDVEVESLGALDRKFIEQINSLIEENLSNHDLAVQDITSALAMSRSLLHRKMKAIVGISIGDYIRKRRIDRACQLLREGYNVSETAYKTGFADPSYFSKTFKKVVGTSPREYVDSLSNKTDNQ